MLGFDSVVNAIKESLQPANAFAVAPNDSSNLSNANTTLFIGTGGNVKADCAKSGTAIIFYNVPDGTLLPVRVKKVYSTGTTASNIIGVY